MIISRYSPFLPTDLDDFDTAIYDQLTSDPFENLFDMNLGELKKNCSVIDFNSARYDTRPELVSWDNYQSLALANIIMMVNDCPSFLNFTRENIGDQMMIPDKLYIQKLLDSQIT